MNPNQQQQQAPYFPSAAQGPGSVPSPSGPASLPPPSQGHVSMAAAPSPSPTAQSPHGAVPPSAGQYQAVGQGGYNPVNSGVPIQQYQPQPQGQSQIQHQSPVQQYPQQHPQQHPQAQSYPHAQYQPQPQHAQAQQQPQAQYQPQTQQYAQIPGQPHAQYQLEAQQQPQLQQYSPAQQQPQTQYQPQTQAYPQSHAYPQAQAQPQPQPKPYQSPAAIVAAATQKWGAPPVRKNLPPPAPAPVPLPQHQTGQKAIPAYLSSRPTSLRNIMSSLKTEARSVAASFASPKGPQPQYRPNPAMAHQQQVPYQGGQPVMYGQPGTVPGQYPQQVQQEQQIQQLPAVPIPAPYGQPSNQGYAPNVAPQVSPEGYAYQQQPGAPVPQYSPAPTAQGQTAYSQAVPVQAAHAQQPPPGSIYSPQPVQPPATHRYSVVGDPSGTQQIATPPTQPQQVEQPMHQVSQGQGQQTLVGSQTGSPGQVHGYPPALDTRHRDSVTSLTSPQPAVVDPNQALHGSPAALTQSPAPPTQPQYGHLGIESPAQAQGGGVPTNYQQYAAAPATVTLPGGHVLQHSSPAPNSPPHIDPATHPYANAAPPDQGLYGHPAPLQQVHHAPYQPTPGPVQYQYPQATPPSAIDPSTQPYSATPTPESQAYRRKPVGTPQKQESPVVPAPETAGNAGAPHAGTPDAVVPAPSVPASPPVAAPSHEQVPAQISVEGSQIASHHAPHASVDSNIVHVQPIVPSDVPQLQAQALAQGQPAPVQAPVQVQRDAHGFEPIPRVPFESLRTQEFVGTPPQIDQHAAAAGFSGAPAPLQPYQPVQEQPSYPIVAVQQPVEPVHAAPPQQAVYYEQQFAQPAQVPYFPPPPPIPAKTPEVPPSEEYYVLGQGTVHKVQQHQIDSMAGAMGNLAVTERQPVVDHGAAASFFNPAAQAPVFAPAPVQTRDMAWLEHEWPRPALAVKETGEPNEVIWDCPGSIRDITYEATYFVLPEVPDFTVCTRCHDRYLKSSPLFSAAFEKTRKANARCRFNVPRITQVLLPQCAQTGNLDPLRDYLRKRLEFKDCKGPLGAKGSEGFSWFIIAADTNDTMINFVSCQACLEDFIYACPYAGEFMPRLDRYTTPHPQDSTWYCDLHFPYVKRSLLIYARNNAPFADWVEKATGRFRLPDCDGTVVESASRNWVRPKDRVEHMVICEKCYFDSFAWTALQDDFEYIPIPKSKTGSEWMDVALGYREAPATAWTCDAKSFPMIQTIEAAVKRQDAGLFSRCARKIMASPPCTEKGIPNGSWYALKADGCEAFAICAACFVGSAEAFDSAQFFKDSPLTGNPHPYICYRNLAAPRFRQFEMKMYQAQQEGVWSFFSDEVREYIDLPLCAGYEHVAGRRWYGWQDCLICPECYKHVCKDTRGDLVLDVENELIEEQRMCCLYSPRMRGKWAEAAAKGDATELVEFSRYRHTVYARTVPQVKMLREMQQMQMMTAMSAGMASIMYQGAGSIQSISGATDRYQHGNSSIGWHDTENGAMAAQKSNEMQSGMSAANNMGTWGQIFMLVQEWEKVQ